MGGAGHARTTAIHNDEGSQMVADTPPSATKPCPLMRPLRIGVFFDGTGNNKYVDKTDGHETNVVRLFDVYKDTSDPDYVFRDKYYLIGVGAGEAPARNAAPVAGHNEPGMLWGQNWVRGSTTSDRWSSHQSTEGTGKAGGAFGKGATDRLQRAYDWVKEKVKAHSEAHMEDSLKLIDIYGFSRGAMCARTFNNLVNQALKTEKPENLYRNIEVRFLGVFDTVDSTVNVEVNMGLSSTDFRFCQHYTARNEVRHNFPLTLLDTNDIEYAGVHSDVGGGYANLGKRDPLDEGKSNWLAGPPLWDMYKASLTQEVEYLRAPTLPGGMTLKDVERIRNESDEFDARGSTKTDAKTTTWMGTYVHKSDNTGIGMGTNYVVPDKDPEIDPMTGMPMATEIKRDRVRVKKFTLKHRPPSFSWNS